MPDLCGQFRGYLYQSLYSGASQRDRFLFFGCLAIA